MVNCYRANVQDSPITGDRKRFSMIKKFGLVFILCMVCGLPCAWAQIDVTTLDKNNTDSMLGQLIGDITEDSNLKIRQVISEAEEEAGVIDDNTKKAEDKILNPWKDKLPFALTLDKIRSFIIAGRAIEKSNRSWDTLIAGADTQEKAVGFYNQGMEEAAGAIREVPGITLEEYRVLYDLSVNDSNFAVLLQALRYHIYPDEASVNAAGSAE